MKNVILITITALALCASPAIALADGVLCPDEESTAWTGAVNSDWFNSGNWTNEVPICPSDPSLYALIDVAPTAQINTGAATACGVLLGDYASDSGKLSVDGTNSGSLTTCSDITVGNYGKGSLSITNGGAVTTGTVVSIAWGTGSSGSATVDGTNGNTNSKWTVDNEFDIGGTTNAAGGTGLLTVTNGGVVTATNAHLYMSGTLTGNSSFSTTNGTVVDGTVSPNGGGTTLTIGGALQLNSGATTQCNVTPQDPSTTPQLNVTGQVSLGGRLSVTMTGDFSSAPTRFTLLYAASVAVNHVKFDSTSITYPTNQCWTPQITYVSTGGHYYVYLDRLVCTH